MERRHRLRRAVDFELLRNEGRRWHHPLILMVVRVNDQHISRFGYSTSRRVGKATSRNRIKRLVVSSEGGRIEGIVSRADLVKLYTMH